MMPLSGMALRHEVSYPPCKRAELNPPSGPDSLQEVVRDIQIGSETLQLGFLSSVLALRGDHVGVQPLVGDSGNILCWNGQVSWQCQDIRRDLA